MSAIFEAQKGGSQNAGPAVGKGGNCDGFLEEVKSQEMEQGGVKIVVRGARGAVMVAAILTGCKPWTSPSRESSRAPLVQLITPDGGSTTAGFSVEATEDRRERELRTRTRAVGPSY